jgi:hypothetical protein
MRIFFSILSIAYVAGIFLFADSSVVSTLSSFNPYSLLHIPLYGILTVLLILSLVPMNPINLSRLSRSESVRGEMRSLFHWDPSNPSNPMNPITQLPNYLITRFLVVGFIALIVAIADEIHQVYVPGREASITDVLLDLVGITLVLFFFFRLLKTKTSITH